MLAENSNPLEFGIARKRVFTVKGGVLTGRQQLAEYWPRLPEKIGEGTPGR
ncbi:hypothetical protein [Ammonifex degensii]|uniref:hypothetical protein n=1 Tax=Ammonifex degensii TaxID=42838 RepID=UPI001FE18CD0|nr:hypothetical protein [Ammonifex degensii]